MTLYGTILKKVTSQDYLHTKHSSPPPEVENNALQKKKKRVFKYAHVCPRVDNSPPKWDPSVLTNRLKVWSQRQKELFSRNLELLTNIKKFHFTRGKVDSRWTRLPKMTYCQPFEMRRQFYQHTNRENKQFYNILINAQSKVVPTSVLRKEWERNRQIIIDGALNNFVLFDPHPKQILEDKAFLPTDGFKRPRVYLTLAIEGSACLGSLAVELFTDVCPLTCSLFQELMDGEQGYGYVGTRFYTKVPGLFWAGGDVVHDNGFGCYAQRGRRAPIGAENYHFSHSIPGLLSMRMTRNNEMCGLFNITFKPLPQFDLKNVVFGRIIRPSNTYDAISRLGGALATRPVVRVTGARRDGDGTGWIHGLANTRMQCIRC